jgi:hypothetical protein
MMEWQGVATREKLRVVGAILAWVFLLPVAAVSLEQNGTMVIEFNDNRAPLRIPTDQIRKITFQPNSPGSPAHESVGKSSPFDGVWRIRRTHTGCCSFSAEEVFTISTDANGITSISGPSFPGKGKVVGNTFPFDYGPRSTGTFVLSSDGKTLTGSFEGYSGSTKHRGTFQGTRLK